MRRQALWIGLAFVPLAALAWASQGPTDDVKGLDATFNAWLDAFNKHDAKALVALYAVDADVVLPSGTRLKGRAAIAKAMGDYFKTNPNVKTKNSVISRRFLTPDIAVEDGEWEDSGLTEVGLPAKGLYATVLAKQQGKWLLVCDRPMIPHAQKKP